MGANVGYARCSTAGQDLDRPAPAARRARRPSSRIYLDKG